MGRRIRLAAAAAVLALVVAGSLWGDDDNWPVGPFRMYSTTTRLDGTVIVPLFEATTADGRRLRLATDDFGLRRAEVLGQLTRLRRRPELLGAFALAHERLHEGAARLDEVRLVAGVHLLRGGRPVGYREKVLASWRRKASSG